MIRAQLTILHVDGETMDSPLAVQRLVLSLFGVASITTTLERLLVTPMGNGSFILEMMDIESGPGHDRLSELAPSVGDSGSGIAGEYP